MKKSFVIFLVSILMVTQFVNPVFAIKNEESSRSEYFSKAISSYGYFTIALKNDSTVWTWGNNDLGQLGDGTVTSSYLPKQVSGLTDIVQVGAGYRHAVALKSDGTVWAWGDNHGGKIGDNTSIQRKTPVQVSGLTDVVKIACGRNFSYALKSDGTVWSWGHNGFGELGDGTTQIRLTPVKAKFLESIIDISSGENHTLALKSDGTVWSWGYNNYGQLGVGTPTVVYWIPQQIKNLSDVTQISAGNSYSLVVKSDGTVYGWGLNTQNQLGNGGSVNTNSPIEIEGLRNVKKISAGIYHSMALKSDGTVWTWGSNTVGQLGDGTTTGASKPIRINGLSNIVNVETGYKFSMAFDIDGNIWSWGENNYGQLGMGTTATIISANKLAFDLGTFRPLLKISDTAKDITSNSARVTVDNSYSTSTEYKFYADGQYVNAAGMVTDQAEGNWYQINGSKDFNIIGLDPSKEYSIQSEARVADGVIMSKSEILKVNTASANPDKPVIRSYDEFDNSIQVFWDKSSFANSYEVYVNGTKVGSTTALNYEFSKSDNINVYVVSVRALNGVTNGENVIESLPYTIRKRNTLPGIMTLSTKANNNSVELSWAEVVNAYGYELYVDGKTMKMGKNTSYVHQNIRSLTQHIYKVRAFNGTGKGPWSAVTFVKTGSSKPLVLNNLVVESSDKDIKIKWDKTKDVAFCNVTIDGTTFGDVKDTFFTKGNLAPNVSYSYKIEIKNEYGEIGATISNTITTKILGTPKGLSVQEESDKVTVSWEPVAGATAYKIMRGTDTLSSTHVGNVFVDGSIPENQHFEYKIQAISGTSESGWSDIITAERIPVKPTKIAASSIKVMALKDQIKIDWSEVATAIGYDIQINETDESGAPIKPVVIDAFNSRYYIHDGLESLKQFQYRVRAKNTATEGDWSDLVMISTLPDVPKTPENIKILTNGSVATLSWDKIVGPTKYRLLIKSSAGKETTVHLGSKNSYHHRRLGNGVEYSYQLQAYNLVGNSSWSGEIVNNHLVARCERGKSIDLGLTAAEVTDFDKYVLKVFYDPGVLTVNDLCGYTGKPELEIGKIEGTDVEITKFKEGEIVFKVNKDIANGYSWTGIINNVKFTPKFNGGSPIGYIVEKIN